MANVPTLNTNLNDNEQKVLDALVKEFNGDFGFTEHQYLDQSILDGITKAQLSGYVSILQDKGWIWTYTGDPEWKNGFEITKQAADHLGIYSSAGWSGE